MATESNSSQEVLPAKVGQTAPTPEADGESSFRKLRTRVVKKAAQLKNSLPWIKEPTSGTEIANGEATASEKQQTPQESGPEEIWEEDMKEFANLEDALAT